jgi:hypothetical protein
LKGELERHVKAKASERAVNFDSFEVIGGGKDQIKAKAHGLE